MSVDGHGSYELDVVGKAAMMREMWEERLANPTQGREETDQLTATQPMCTRTQTTSNSWLRC